jgi:murein DD-endopeptidase MepM/ murein hydrolase activator NlpD
MPQWPKQREKKRSHLSRYIWAGCLLAGLGAGLIPHSYASKKPNATPDNGQRLIQIYDRVSQTAGLPWQAVAAIDRYERTLSRAHPKTRPIRPESIVGVYISEARWAGELNPDSRDTNPATIRFFGGIGQDGSGDGIADRSSDADLLYTIVKKVKEFGTGEDDFAIGLWEYYQNTRAVQRVLQFIKIIEAFGRSDLSRHAFPLPLASVYSYRSTWGDSRGWGGYRIHEGTDIFAGYGVPVRSTSYGIVELKGWNRFGGWRIGIRDLDNLYHYYAHLQGFDKKLKTGDVVQPGQVIGWVGSSGYGRPGTQGKFPPHLHYGVYRDRGYVEWAFDPYPMLRKWEREERKALRVTR